MELGPQTQLQLAAWLPPDSKSRTIGEQFHSACIMRDESVGAMAAEDEERALCLQERSGDKAASCDFL